MAERRAEEEKQHQILEAKEEERRRREEEMLGFSAAAVPSAPVLRREIKQDLQDELINYLDYDLTMIYNLIIHSLLHSYSINYNKHDHDASKHAGGCRLISDQLPTC